MENLFLTDMLAALTQTASQGAATPYTDDEKCPLQTHMHTKASAAGQNTIAIALRRLTAICGLLSTFRLKQQAGQKSRSCTGCQA